MKHINLLTAGSFGESVADRLAQEYEISSLSLFSEQNVISEFIKSGNYLAVAAWRDYPEVFNFIDQICWKYKIRWSLAYIDGVDLCCGPLIVPEKGTCFNCFQRRSDSHQKSPDRLQSLRQYYTGNNNRGVEGYVQPMVEIAVSSLIEDKIAPSHLAGKFRKINVLTANVMESENIGIHGCALCRSKGDDYDPRNRYIEHLVGCLDEGIS
jgi:hypothetical protein